MLTHPTTARHRPRRASDAAAASAPPSIACDFRSVSYGVKNARLGLRLQLDDFPLSSAESLFCGQFLHLRLHHSREVDGEVETLHAAIHGEATGYRRTASGAISTSIRFAIGEADADTIQRFSGRQGTLQIQEAARPPPDAEEEADADAS